MAKSGQRARLEIDAPASMPVRHPVRHSVRDVVGTGIDRAFLG